MTRERSPLTPESSVPTLADVARRANVSTATVSRCLNSPDQVIERTRNRVMDAVNELGYAPNFSARALAARHTNTIGAVIPTMDNAIFARGIQAFQEELGRHGFTLLVASSSYKEALEEEQIRTLAARGADGLLLIGYHRNPALHEFLRARSVPALVAWAYEVDSDIPAIGFSNRNAMADLARLVFEKGHRDIGMISADTKGNDRARDRLAGVRLAAREAAIDVDRMPVIETTYSIESGMQAFRQIMGWTPRPTAVFCGNDVLAIGALKAAKEMGLSVPEDVSITGFDDIEIASLAEPALTTVHVPHREMGRRAAGMLIDMVTKRTVPESVELQTDIRLRRSLGPPKT
ncbi:LacI family DNA-binding transcriptional regulator [Boseongicola aestuarii]|uniref:HTH-type transcriptional repressor PurR n=1 Tax=Boseongicola aestuarii TaxID=1470561 RepID=A0A238J0U8_9RHOB|nr:LacI family DNA-binding transcriptional regulator [Boseongicola aestuarii]SMX23872.1 HTH-type transcriptional repressor PurR [Boseongicola aestuarii]